MNTRARARDSQGQVGQRKKEINKLPFANHANKLSKVITFGSKPIIDIKQFLRFSILNRLFRKQKKS